MKKFKLALALAGAVGLVAACGGGSDDAAETAPDESGSNAVTAPIEKATDAVADLENAASTSQTLTFSVDGMT